MNNFRSITIFGSHLIAIFELTSLHYLIYIELDTNDIMTVFMVSITEMMYSQIFCYIFSYH